MSYPSVSFQLVTPQMGTQPIGNTETTQAHTLGKIVTAKDVNYGEADFIYLKGVTSTAAGDLVFFDQKAGTTVRAVHGGAGCNGPAAIAMSANVANQYGWYAVRGSVPVKAATVLANAAVYLTSTAGQVDDAVVAGDRLDGVYFKAADSGNFATVQLSHPSLSNETAISGATITTELLTDAQPTAGSGTGYTLAYSGKALSGWFKVTVDKTAWVAAATTQDVTLLTLPAKARILAVVADTTAAYAGLSGTIQIKIGATAGGAEVLAAHDVKSAAVTKGLADADLGTAMVRAAAIQGAYLPSWTATTAITVRLTSGTGNIGDGVSTTNLSAGSTTYYFKIEQPA